MNTTFLSIDEIANLMVMVEMKTTSLLQEVNTMPVERYATWVKDWRFYNVLWDKLNKVKCAMPTEDMNG